MITRKFEVITLGCPEITVESFDLILDESWAIFTNQMEGRPDFIVKAIPISQIYSIREVQK